jgi:hypothetical protein
MYIAICNKVWDARFAKFFSSDTKGFKVFGMSKSTDNVRVTFTWHQILQARCRVEYIAAEEPLSQFLAADPQHVSASRGVRSIVTVKQDASW